MERGDPQPMCLQVGTDEYRHGQTVPAVTQPLRVALAGGNEAHRGSCWRINSASVMEGTVSRSCSPQGRAKVKPSSAGDT